MWLSGFCDVNCDVKNWEKHDYIPTFAHITCIEFYYDKNIHYDKMKNKISLLALCLALALLTSCGGGQKDAEEKGVSTVLPDSKNEVTVVKLVRQDFQHELVSNGKVSAQSVANLNFESGGVVAHIFVKNGDAVRKGQKLAELDKFRLTNKLAQAKDALERAKLDLQDVLIGQGYPAGDTSKVPVETMQLAKVKSGYDQSMAQYELARYEEEHATLTAPFDGVVANLFAKPFNNVNTSETFCTLIDTQGMEVDFSVLESELPLIKKDDKVKITPYAAAVSLYEGRVTEINPLVDEKGMVKVRARVSGKGLYSGMNVRVSVFRSLPGQLVIPKQAVVLRSGKQVVFTLDGEKAKWNYVFTGLENADSYTILEDTKDKLYEGDIVIATGNINLAHEAPVTVVKQ